VLRIFWKGEKMRYLTKREIYKRGCIYCLDKSQVHDHRGGVISQCPYDKCPYHELDNVKTYGEYIQKTNKSGLARVLANLAKEE
jgi:hypothetical protein